MTMPGWAEGAKALHGFEEWVIWFNLAGAACSTVLNATAARLAAPTAVAQRHAAAAVAVLSAVYVVGYLVLLTGPFSLLDWSRTMRFISMFVWPVVWCAPAYAALRWPSVVAKATGQRIVDGVAERAENEE